MWRIDRRQLREDRELRSLAKLDQSRLEKNTGDAKDQSTSHTSLPRGLTPLPPGDRRIASPERDRAIGPTSVRATSEPETR